MSKPSPFSVDYIHIEPIPVPEYVYIVGEMGINHNGDLDLAKQLIDMAKDVGCDAVKFQKRTIDKVYTPEMLDSPRESPWGSTQREQKEGIEFGEDEYDAIDAYCKEKDIEWFASAWDAESLQFLSKYKLPYNKVASAMATHFEFLEAVAKQHKPTFFSVGMCTWDDIDKGVEIFKKQGCPIILMHTVSEYPAAEEILNLQGIHTLRKRYECPVGYSGHEPSVSPSVIAASFGAVAVERHITLDRAMYGSDQAASLERNGLQHMIEQIRKISIIAGDGERKITEKEHEVAAKLRYWKS